MQTKLEKVASLATIAASMAAIGALIFGYCQFKDTQEAERQSIKEARNSLSQMRESQAYDLLMKYNEVMMDKLSKPASQDWRDNEALNISEAIYLMENNDPGWVGTTRWMIGNQASYLKRTKIECGTYNQGFIQLAIEENGGVNFCDTKERRQVPTGSEPLMGTVRGG